MLNHCCRPYITDWCVLNSVGASGGQLLGWNNSKYEMLVSKVGVFFLSAKFKDRSSQEVFFISSVYGPCQDSRRQELWQEFRETSIWNQGPWLIGGDFNITRFANERDGRLVHQRSMEDFNNVIRDLHLLDPPISGRRFTWTNDRTPPSSAKLDRFLVSPEWEDKFPLSLAQALPRPLSDHTPIMFDTKKISSKEKPFRFEKIWLTHADFDKDTKTFWESHPFTHIRPGLRIIRKLRELRRFLKKWAKEKFGCVIKEKKDLLQKIQLVDSIRDQRPLSELEAKSRWSLMSELDSCQRKEEMMWAQRSKTKWLKEGDSNTMYFHRMATQRKRTNHISLIQDDVGTSTNHREITKAFTDFWRSSIGTEHCSALFADWDLLFANNQVEMPSLEEPFTLEEIKDALFSFGPEKAPGPDGYPPLFFQHFWDMIKEDLMATFSELYEGSLNLSNLNSAFIALVPKKKGANRTTDFRPISLLNTTFKIITKVLANRLRKYMPNLIEESQSAFMKGKSTLDSVAAAHEIISACHHKKWNGFFIKLDFAKAFDSIGWKFLEDVLAARGFGSKWLRWIKACLYDADSQVIVNGVPGPHIRCKRGLRQGDPLSPYLFILGIDILARVMHRAVDNGFIQRVGNLPINTHFSCLQYADDTLLIAPTDTRSIENIKILLVCFELLSGLKINFDKSAIYPLGNTTTPEVVLASNIFQCSHGVFPMTYLGIPLKPTTLTRADWIPMIDKVETRLDSWKGKCLSRGGRLILVNSVLSAIPMHYLSFFIFPSWVLKRIDSIRRSFFWSGEKGAKGCSSLVNWETVCTPKDKGGLGVLDLRLFNLALMAKWWWRFQFDSQRLWAQLVKFFYYKNNVFWEFQEEPPRICSHFWKGVLKAVKAFRIGARFICANGLKIHFWSDLWIGEQPLRLAFPSLYEIALNKEGSIASQRQDGAWNLAFTHLLSTNRRADLGSLLDLLMKHQWTTGEDTISWTLTNSACFTVKSLYQKLKDTGVKDAGARTIWGTTAPLKVRINLWLAYKGALLTSDVLARRHIATPFNCPLCNSEIETSKHLFLTCPFATQIWTNLCIKFHLPSPPPNLVVLLTTWRRRKISRNIAKDWDMKLAAALWIIWKERNDRIFRNTSSSVSDTINKIDMFTSSWASILLHRS